jgi:5-methylcytosine-specific restriction endonuclease McrA
MANSLAERKRQAEYMREWRAKNHEKLLEAERIRYAKNPKKFLDRAKAWHEKNKEKAREAYRNWKSVNYERVLDQNRNRASQRRANGGSFTIQEWYEILDKYGHKCLRCGRSDVKLTIDHIKPIALGGTHTADNIQPLCSSCNSSKQASEIDYR